MWFRPLGTFCLTALLLSACVKPQGGDAVGVSGGDTLADARDALISVLNHLQDPTKLANFARSEVGCEIHFPAYLCDRLSRYQSDPEMLAYLQGVILAERSRLLEILRNGDIPFVVKTGPLYATDSQGNQIQKKAVVVIAQNGGSQVHVDAQVIEESPLAVIVSLLGHEIMHLAQPQYHDDDPKSFGSGRQITVNDLYDLLGTGLALFNPKILEDSEIVLRRISPLDPRYPMCELSDPYSLHCRWVSHVNCREAGYEGGFGFLDYDGAKVTVACFKSSAASYREFSFTAPDAGSCTSEKYDHLECHSYTRRKCQDEGFASSIGVTGANATAVGTLCVKPKSPVRGTVAFLYGELNPEAGTRCSSESSLLSGIGCLPNVQSVCRSRGYPIGFPITDYSSSTHEAIALCTGAVNE